MIILYDQHGKKESETTGLADRLSLDAYCLNDLQIALRNGSKAEVRVDGHDIASFDTVYFRTIARKRDMAAIAADYLQDHNVPFVDREALSDQSLSKLHQMYLLHKNNLPIPDTYYGDVVFIESKLQYPFIYKATVASKGEDNFLVHSSDEIRKGTKSFIAQTYIPNEADYRLLVFGNKVELIIKRSRTGDTHLNNTSQGARAELVSIADFDQTIINIAIRAASVLKRDIAGVDIMLDEQNNPYILEVNRTPQLATGAFVEEKLHAFKQYIH